MKIKEDGIYYLASRDDNISLLSFTEKSLDVLIGLLEKARGVNLMEPAIKELVFDNDILLNAGVEIHLYRPGHEYTQDVKEYLERLSGRAYTPNELKENHHAFSMLFDGSKLSTYFKGDVLIGRECREEGTVKVLSLQDDPFFIFETLFEPTWPNGECFVCITKTMIDAIFEKTCPQEPEYAPS